MRNTLSYAIQQIEAREDLFAPIPCALCWFRSATEGALCAECIFTNKIKVTEGQTEKDTII